MNRDALYAELFRLKSWRDMYEAFDSDVDSRIREIESFLYPVETERAAA